MAFTLHAKLIVNKFLELIAVSFFKIFWKGVPNIYEDPDILDFYFHIYLYGFC